MKQLLFVGLAALAVTPALAEDGLISSLNWHNIDAYCTFQRGDQLFDYNDPSTWTFVFFTQLADGPDETAFISIDHRLRQLEPLEVVQGKDGETRQYRTYGEPSYEVTLTISKDREGYENTDYKGFLSVAGPSGNDSIEIKGGCGV